MSNTGICNFKNIPLMTCVDGHYMVHDFETGASFDDDENDIRWIGICTDSKFDVYWYIGQVNNVRTFHKLISKNYSDASIEAKTIIDEEYKTELMLNILRDFENDLSSSLCSDYADNVSECEFSNSDTFEFAN